MKILGLKTHGVTVSMTDSELRMILDDYTDENHRIAPDKEIKLERNNQ